MTNNNINYSFPNITYIGNIFDYNNRFFYDILEFSYTPDNNRNNCQVTCTNNAIETFDPAICVSRGKIATNQFGNNAAPLLGFRSLQYSQGLTAIQMISERCRLGGWLEQMIDQNNNKCCQGNLVDLQFSLNNDVYNCSPGAEGLNYMFYEELNGLALALPIRRIWNRDLGGANVTALNRLFTEKLLFEEVSSATGTDFIDEYGKPAQGMIGGRNKTLEICTVISDTPNSKNFNCRP